ALAPALDLRGKALLIKDHTDAVVGTAEVVAFDDESNETAEVVLKAPARVGTYSWSVVCPAMAADGISLEAKAEPFAITVKAHETRIVVWGVPPTVVVGETFRLKVGIKCSGECRLDGRPFAIFDNDGAQVASGALGG